MNPTFLDEMSWEMAEVYGAIQDQIMINLARYFPYYNAGDPIPASSFAYQAKMLAQMGQVNKETVRIIRNGLADADSALYGVMEQSIIDAVRGAEPGLYEAVKKGVFAMPTTPIVSPNQTRAFKLYYQQAAEKLNMVNTVMLESTQSAYAQAVSDVVSNIELADRMNRTQIALDTAAGETVTGVSTWNQALKHATDRLKEGGITGFVDHAGHHWSAEAYVAMDIRTTVANTARAAIWETNQNFGNDLYSVSYHNGARPLCYPWQNRVISSTDSARTVYDLDGNPIEVVAQSATSYGQAAGLFGINCKHYPTPFIPGVSVIEGQPQNEEDNARTYEESQEQRRMERKIREQKRDLEMLKAQGAPEEEIAKQREKIKKSSQEIDDFCQETGRARHRDREAVYTRREFPDADKYDVSQFEREQKDRIDSYYRNGGAQQAYKASALQNTQDYDNIGLERRTQNPGIFSQFPERMSKKHIREVAKEYGLDLKGMTLVIRQEEQFLKPSWQYTGSADYLHVGKIDFFPKAFVSKEELVRTIFHERLHVLQYREFGTEYVMNNRADFEKLAYDAEDAFIDELKKGGRL